MKKRLIKILVITIALVNIAMASVFVFHEFLDFTSSNSALYFLRGRYGGIEIRRDLLLEDAKRVIFMLDANSIFNYLVKGIAVAKHKSVLELTWDEDVGFGHVKQFRPDGTELTFPFSRFMIGERVVQGLFLGGDLSYGDMTRSDHHNTSGMGYFDGERWYHIWCRTNEGIRLRGGKLISVNTMDFLGSRVLKNTEDEVILQSDHRLVRDSQVIGMRRFASFRAGDDYYTLKVMFTNEGLRPVIYGYAWGDEPWVGDFGSSRGDIGWYQGGLIKTERIISPNRFRYAGFWDYGNDIAGEGHDFTGKANFVEWAPPVPSYVMFSNSLEKCCDEKLPLSSDEVRIVSVMWHDQMLMPGESRTYTLAVGMAALDPDTGMPAKPATSINQ
jgi:hypothetical protein